MATANSKKASTSDPNTLPDSEPVKKTVSRAKKTVAEGNPDSPAKKSASKVAEPATSVTVSVPDPVQAVATATRKEPEKAPLAAEPNVISEAELLKMSDKDYMNTEQLAFFRHRLQSMKDEIISNARETGEHLKENEVFADPNDRATVEEENMLEQRVRDRERKLLKKIDASLRRIEAGDYGYCLGTGDPIGLPRLLARPTAELSIEAQEKHERLEKLFAD